MMTRGAPLTPAPVLRPDDGADSRFNETSDAGFGSGGYLGGPVPTLIRGCDGQGRPVVVHAAPSPLDPADVRELGRQGLCAWKIAKLRGCLPVHVAETCLLHGIRLRPTREREGTHNWRSGPRMKGLR